MHDRPHCRLMIEVKTKRGRLPTRVRWGRLPIFYYRHAA